MVLAFCKSNTSLAESDKERVDFAKDYLQDFRFMYQDTDDDDRAVSYSIIIILVRI